MTYVIRPLGLLPFSFAVLMAAVLVVDFMPARSRAAFCHLAGYLVYLVRTSFGGVEPIQNIPLHSYVSSRLETAAIKYESGNIRDALLDLEHVHATLPSVYEESVYMRALCLHSLGEFDQAAADYEIVAKYSPLLESKALLGLELSRSRGKVSRELAEFPVFFESDQSVAY